MKNIFMVLAALFGAMMVTAGFVCAMGATESPVYVVVAVILVIVGMKIELVTSKY